MLLFSSLGTIDFLTIFGEDYQNAEIFCKKHQVEIQIKADHYKLPAKELKAIVFPELIRYSSFQNFFETKALEYIYTEHGSAAADFSIGPFQMKPSFVEKLEVVLEQNEELRKKFEQLQIPSSYEIKEQRVLRLKRLQKRSWQLDYLCCFYCFINQKFNAKLASLNHHHRLKWIATAYNTGFDKSFERIEAAMYRASYPYGSKYPENGQYVYAEVTLHYYQRQ